MIHRTYTFPAGKVMWRVENHPEYILLGERINIAKSSIVGVAITDLSAAIPSRDLFSSIQSVDAFPTCKEPVQLFIVYDPPDGGPRNFASYSMVPANSECRELLVDLKEELGDRLLGIGPAQLVADRLGVGDLHRQAVAKNKRVLLIASVLFVLGFVLFIWKIAFSSK